MTIHPDSSTLAVKVTGLVYSLGLSNLILVSPSHDAASIWIGWVSRSGSARRQLSNGDKFMSWLTSNMPKPNVAIILLERSYNIALQRNRNNQPSQHDS